jgi:tetratricopeptide (TPR) repeat protein
VSLWVFASAFILVYPAISLGQAISWEEQRRAMLDMHRHGQLHEAFESARKMLAEAERHEPSSAPLPLALHDYAVISGDLNLYADAEKALRRAIRLVETAPARDEALMRIFELRLAEVYFNSGRYQEAKTLFNELQRVLEETQPESAELAITLDHLGWIEVSRRNFAPAESFFQRSIHLLEIRTDGSPFRMGDVLNDYASLLYTMKRYTEAASYCERVLSLFNAQAEANPTLINAWILLAASYANTGRVQAAEGYARRAISASQSIYGEDSDRAGKLMGAGAVVLQRCGDKAEAKALRRKADQILANAYHADPRRFTVDVNALR